MKKFISIDPTKVKEHCDHITILFADGEENSTKGGDCWGMRSMHCLSMPVCGVEMVPPEYSALFDKEYNGYKCAYIYEEYEDTKRIVKEYRDMLELYLANRKEIV